MSRLDLSLEHPGISGFETFTSIILGLLNVGNSAETEEGGIGLVKEHISLGASHTLSKVV